MAKHYYVHKKFYKNEKEIIHFFDHYACFRVERFG